ncbi:MAG: MaoC family dehydratase N-terminal domain-containing protein [Alphaproteobacteria bacterium]|nr:MaoC family dehydratase N-terminal domain-containing protein [Alphaproteobacteria bacterium]NQV59447.1 MaoC family dehydratase N-terminal domain-containing protein [Alphaproteobacteria bacterium]
MTLKASEISVGDTFEEVLVEDLKRTQLVMYAGTSGDYNPLHTDEVYCREAAGYPGVFAHGMLTMGMTGRVVTNLFGPENIKKYGVRFTNQVWPGDNLSGKAEIEAIRQEGGETLVDIKLTTTNQKGDVVITGNATGRVDP